MSATKHRKTKLSPRTILARIALVIFLVAMFLVVFIFPWLAMGNP